MDNDSAAVKAATLTVRIKGVGADDSAPASMVATLTATPATIAEAIPSLHGAFGAFDSDDSTIVIEASADGFVVCWDASGFDAEDIETVADLITRREFIAVTAMSTAPDGGKVPAPLTTVVLFYDRDNDEASVLTERDGFILERGDRSDRAELWPWIQSAFSAYADDDTFVVASTRTSERRVILPKRRAQARIRDFLVETMFPIDDGA